MKIKVMIIEDSASVREMLRTIIGGDSRLEVVACVETAEAGLRILHRTAPDVISMDIRLPGIDGLEATLRIMAEKPTPIVVVSDNVDGEELKISMNALRAGALTVIEKPHGFGHPDHASYSRGICDQLVNMSAVKVVRQRFSRNLPFGARGGPEKSGRTRRPEAPFNGFWDPRIFKILGVTASTGGPSALVQLFQSLPRAFPLPIVLVQHITPSFLGSFSSWLGSSCPFKTVIAADGEVPRPGAIYLAPPDRHLEVGSECLRLSRAEPVCSQRPSGDVLFGSMARNLGEGSLAVLLTGMGADGAEGLLEVRKAGGYTLAEDHTTAVVYGMPEVAVRIGAVCESLPLDLIGPRVVELISAKGKSEA